MKPNRIPSLLIVMLLVVSVGKAQITHKVAIIGNSITEGTGLANPTVNSYPGQLGNMLPADWQVGNFGVSGRTMLKKGDFPIWNEQKFADALNFEPNIVVVMLGTNDSKYYNWAYKDEFYSDYVSMIDTFASLPTKPEIIICYPPKVFSHLYDIDDAVIHDEIIPIIHKVAEDKNLKIIDCYTPTSDKPSIFSDGIHPNIGGAHFVAEIFYTGLTGNPYQVIYDENLALKARVVAESYVAESGTNLNPTSAVDADLVSFWNFKGYPSTLIIDLGTVSPVDQFQLYFRNHAAAGLQYKIETSTDSLNWTLTVDHSSRNDVTLPYSIDKINSMEMRYIRITFTGSATGYEDVIEINEFKVLKAQGHFHAPAISAKIDRIYYGSLTMIPDETTQYMSFYTFNKTAKVFELNKSVEDFTKPFTYDYRASSPDPYFFMTNAYTNGIEVFSDTTKVKHVRSTTEVNPIRTENTIFQVYPNPATGAVRISARQPVSEPFQISIFNAGGKLVITLTTTGILAKNQEIIWNRTNDSGSKVTSGMYFIRIEGKTIHENLKVTLH